MVRISSVAGSDVWLEKSERVIPACSRAGGAAGFASMQVRSGWRAGWVQSLDATGSMASCHGFLQEQCLLFLGHPGLLGASAGSVLCFQSKRGYCKLRLSVVMARAMPQCVLPGFMSVNNNIRLCDWPRSIPSSEVEEKEEMKTALWGRPWTASSACPIALVASLCLPHSPASFLDTRHNHWAKPRELRHFPVPSSGKDSPSSPTSGAGLGRWISCSYHGFHTPARQPLSLIHI